MAQYLTLGVEREVFAIPVEQVQEILDSRDTARLPGAPEEVAGLIDVRGRSVPLIDLRVKLGLPRVAANDTTRIVILDLSASAVLRAGQLGLITDCVHEVTSLDEAAMDPPPEFGRRWNSEIISGIARWRDKFVIALDLERLLTCEQAHAAAPSAS
jgi:purine-binding chemotaxis protein CheW